MSDACEIHHTFQRLPHTIPRSLHFPHAGHLPIWYRGLPIQAGGSDFHKVRGLPSSHISGFDVIFGSPYGLAASHTPAPFPISRGISHTFSRFPHAIQRPPTQAISPYGHRPFPHTSRQIPIGRPFSHSHGRSPIARPSPHTIHNLLKIGLSFDETSVPAPQIPNQPRQANTRDLRYTSANQAPASSSKSHIPATGGCSHLLHAHTYVRPWSCMHGYAHTFMITRAHGQGHTFTCTRTAMFTRAPSQACAYLHGHGARRDQRTAHTDQAPIQLTQMPCGCVTSPQIKLQSN